MTNTLNIQQRLFDDKAPCFVIAEAGVNHNGDLDTALSMIDEAKYAGANAIKFQTFNADYLCLPNAPKCTYQIRETGLKQSQYEMLKRLEISKSFHEALIKHAKKRQITFLSTPFDEQSSDFLEALGVSALKIPSGEITNIPFLRHVAAKNLPLIISTGMASLGEIETIVETIAGIRGKDFGDGLVLMHCLSCYPAPVNEVNLKAMNTLRTAFGLPVGFSDHTQGVEVALAAVALGSRIIEKHFTLDKTQSGPDHRASLEPNELANMIRQIRIVEESLGDGYKRPQPSELDVAKAVRKSITSRYAIAKGAILEPNMFIMRRPGTGLSPDLMPLLFGRIAVREIPEDSMISLEDIGGGCAE